MNLPQKLMTGMNFKQAVVNKINEIITYLSTQRFVGDGKNIVVNQYTSAVGIQFKETGSNITQDVISDSFINFPVTLTR